MSSDTLPAPLPGRAALAGPVTSKKLQRTLAVYLLVAASGLGLAVTSQSPTWTAFGLGLISPGGGLWLVASPGQAAVAVVVVIVLGGLVWILSGAMFVWPLLWIGAAGLAAHHASGHHLTVWPAARWLVPVVTGLFLAGCIAARAVAWVIARRRTETVNARLAEHVRTPRVWPSTPPVEPGGQDLGLLRYLLNLVLQPVDSFEGFDLIDQFQTSSIRYQLTAVQTALAVYQSAHTPAFGGYLVEAQQATVRKMTDARVWRYWFWENLIGNFRIDRDPVARDNIMFSGYLGAMLGTYRLGTSDTSFDIEGCLVFRSGGHEFRYDHGRVAQAVHTNMIRGEFCLYPCEPNFIYPVCNAIGLAGLFAYDESHGTSLAAQVIPRFRKSWDEEFLAYSGRPLLMRSSRLGLTLPMLRMAANDAAIAAVLQPVLPDIAHRTWNIMRDDAIRFRDGEIDVRMAPWERVDPGTYRPSSAATYAALAAAAAVLGDGEIREGMLAAVERCAVRDTREGMSYFPRLSVLTNAGYAAARFHRAAVATADATSPMLAEVAYPDVLVARAVALGGELSMILEPGDGPRAHEPLRLARLHPGRRYRLIGGGQEHEVTASAAGEAIVHIRLHERCTFSLCPAP
ncbi:MULTISPECIES: hypothetical protein [unclassified Mycobacteroides]|uniref:linalool dehydratase/isomerase domain-containing protein n=1 Tax=unclassified Mycobacteroides TaxID=2618759 RepID=UPI001EEFF6F6|nr:MULTISPECIES: hypothetical protein [unclassified Mycobacteroides]